MGGRLRKRIIDLTVCLLAAPLWMAAIGLSALAILLFDGRPVFYRSRRRVYRDQSSDIVKLRTMVRNAEQVANRDTVPVTDQRFLNLSTGSPLYSRVGKAIERVQFTELPQLFTVLRGRMSLVGNRPLPENVISALAEVHDNVEDRFETKCGLTGPVQLIGRDSLPDHQRLAVEAAYCERTRRSYSAWLDLKILIYTVLIALRLREPLPAEHVHRLITGDTQELPPARIDQQPTPQLRPVRKTTSTTASATVTHTSLLLLPALLIISCGFADASSDYDGGKAHDPDSPWAVWTERDEPVFRGEYVASDPTIVRDGSSFRMYYTGLIDMTVLPETAKTGEVFFHTVICGATSEDGVHWKDVATIHEEYRSVVLRGREGHWDENLEGSLVVRHDDQYLLYFSGYKDEGNPARGFPAALSLAVSEDGVRFKRESDEPILKPTPGWFDNEAIYSPTMIRSGGEFVMVYAGHCYTDCRANESEYSHTQGGGVFLIGATSRDGRKWTKHPLPLLGPTTEIKWMLEGAAEPHLLLGPDGMYYLFFVGLQGDRRVMGIARSSEALGPYEVNPVPILVPAHDFDEAGVFAPHVEIEGKRVRMWYHGFTNEEVPTIGYAEATWPLYSERPAPPN